MSKSYRLCISIPGELKRRIDDAAPDLNLSAVAAAALDREVSRRERRQPREVPEPRDDHGERWSWV